MRVGRIAAAAAAIALLAAPGAAADARWVGTWSTALYDPGLIATSVPFFDGVGGRTVRNVVHTSIGGVAGRVRLSNAFGTGAVQLDHVRLGRRDAGAGVVPGTNRVVRFGGRRSVTIAPGAVAVSDPVWMPIPADEDLAISLYSARPTGPATVHAIGSQTSYVSVPGDFAGDARGVAFTTASTAWYFAAGVDVLAPGASGAVVALGDSITDGASTTRDANQRWTDHLARRLLARPGRAMGVLNAGINSNQVQRRSPCHGQSGLERLERDVLSQPGVRTVILLEGVNDLILPVLPQTNACVQAAPTTARDIIAAYREIAARVHGRGLRIVAGTITPFGNYRSFTTGEPVWTPALEAEREAINRWIRTTERLDGVVDFAAVLADPADPTKLAARFDFGDGLHPNDAGMRAMADAIDLRLLARTPAHQPPRRRGERSMCRRTAASTLRWSPAAIAFTSALWTARSSAVIGGKSKSSRPEARKSITVR